MNTGIERRRSRPCPTVPTLTLPRPGTRQLVYFYVDDDAARQANAELASSDRNTDLSLSLGSLNLKWGAELSRVRWSPTFRPIPNASQPLQHLRANSSALWIPYHSLCGFNIGHLFFDDWLPM